MMLGLSSAQVVVSFAVARENVPDTAVGLCIAIVNMGVFLTIAIVQIALGGLLEWSAGGRRRRLLIISTLWCCLSR